MFLCDANGYSSKLMGTQRTPVDLKDKYRNLLKHFSQEQLLSGK